MKGIAILLFLVGFAVSAHDYHFVSIDQLVEQEIGRLVLPEIYASIGVNITIKPLPAKRAQYEVRKGISDGEIMRIFSYGAENPSTIRVPTPYYYLETMAFVRADSQLSQLTESDLARYSIAKVRGVKHTNNITQGLPVVHDLNSTNEIMRLVAKGRVDIALTNTVDGLMTLKELGIDNVVPINQPLAVFDLYHYLHKKNAHLVPKVDKAIIALKQSGKLDNLIQAAEDKLIDKQYQKLLKLN